MFVKFLIECRKKACRNTLQCTRVLFECSIMNISFKSFMGQGILFGHHLRDMVRAIKGFPHTHTHTHTHTSLPCSSTSPVTEREDTVKIKI